MIIMKESKYDITVFLKLFLRKSIIFSKIYNNPLFSLTFVTYKKAENRIS